MGRKPQSRSGWRRAAGGGRVTTYRRPAPVVGSGGGVKKGCAIALLTGASGTLAVATGIVRHLVG